VAHRRRRRRPNVILRPTVLVFFSSIRCGRKSTARNDRSRALAADTEDDDGVSDDDESAEKCRLDVAEARSPPSSSSSALRNNATDAPAPGVAPRCRMERSTTDEAIMDMKCRRRRPLE